MKGTVKMLLTVLLVFAMLLSFPALDRNGADAASDITKVNVKLNMFPVNAGEVSAVRASLTTGSCYISSLKWYDMSGNLLTERFDNNIARMELSISAAAGAKFSPGVQATLNGEAVAVTNYGSSVVISRSYIPVIWAPGIVKHPTDEEIVAGNVASFVAYGSFVNESRWVMADPDGNYIDPYSLPELFPDTEVEISFDKLRILNTPKAMDGYRAYCEFSGPGGEVRTRAAEVKVKTWEEYADEMAALKAAEEAAAAALEKGEEAEELDSHEHSFYDQLSFDGAYHWKECSCGFIQDKQPHSFQWVQYAPAKENEPGFVQGICSVCGLTINCDTYLDGQGPETQ